MRVRRRWWLTLLGAASLAACTAHGEPTPAQLCEHVVDLYATAERASV